MKTKIFMSAAFMLLCGVSANAQSVPVHTSCGKTVQINSENYASAAEMIADIIAIDEAICG